jgi:hypothetical protein
MHWVLELGDTNYSAGKNDRCAAVTDRTSKQRKLHVFGTSGRKGAR